MSESDRETRPFAAGFVETEAEEAGEKRRRTLRERAGRLARERQEEERGEVLELVEFLIGPDRYGLETSYVREVHPAKGVTPLPCVPPFVLGVMNLRGTILSVVDLAAFFETGRGEVTESSKVIVARLAGMEFAILAQQVIGVLSTTAASLQPLPAATAGARSEYVKGIGEGHLLLIDAEKLLSDRRIVVHEEV